MAAEMQTDPLVSAYHRVLKRLLQKHTELSAIYDPLYDVYMDDAVIAATKLLNQSDDVLREEFVLLSKVGSAAISYVQLPSDQGLLRICNGANKLKAFRDKHGYF